LAFRLHFASQLVRTLRDLVFLTAATTTATTAAAFAFRVAVAFGGAISALSVQALIVHLVRVSRLNGVVGGGGDIGQLGRRTGRFGRSDCLDRLRGGGAYRSRHGGCGHHGGILLVQRDVLLRTVFTAIASTAAAAARATIGFIGRSIRRRGAVVASGIAIGASGLVGAGGVTLGTGGAVGALAAVGSAGPLCGVGALVGVVFTANTLPVGSATGPCFRLQAKAPGRQG